MLTRSGLGPIALDSSKYHNDANLGGGNTMFYPLWISAGYGELPPNAFVKPLKHPPEVVELLATQS
jgi:hypothetical protein